MSFWGSTALGVNTAGVHSIDNSVAFGEHQGGFTFTAKTAGVLRDTSRSEAMVQDRQQWWLEHIVYAFLALVASCGTHVVAGDGCRQTHSGGNQSQLRIH